MSDKEPRVVLAPPAVEEEDVVHAVRTPAARVTDGQASVLFASGGHFSSVPVDAPNLSIIIGKRRIE
jgi:hypothetical protein